MSTSSPAVVVSSTQGSPPTELSEVLPLPISPVVTNGCSSRRDAINSLHHLRHGSTPRRTPTPSSRASSPPPSLTTQTQIASLRGALEAARQREAQMKFDLERHAKDLESMYWERANWKRKEFELQYQVQYLAHQLQSFAVSVSQMNLNGSSAVPSTSSSSRNSSSSPNTSPGNKTSQVPLPSEKPLSLHVIPPPPQVQPPPSMFSPSSPMHLLPVYYPYSHMSHQQQPHGFSHFPSQPLHPFPVSPTQRAANYAGLMAALSPHPAASPSPGPLASGPSSATASSSSVGSMSPEGVHSSTIPMVDRGRRKTRTTERVGVWLDAGGEDDVFLDGGNDDGLDYGEDEVSEMLADAILKRPGSLGLGRTRDKKSRSTSAADHRGSPDSEIAQTEFTFPSLSDFGNVKWGKRARMDGENEEDVGTNGRTGSAIGEANATQYAQERPSTKALNIVFERSHVGVSDLPDG
ncbi:hypothetical protein M378DRAFT_165264 [Amanita muscaria Koide BX008]|uniref:Uncharacterized protein n=1 Tax=Amanita muscaria (strain Koide BX008) TaxID=946122 RepID=A0A0C2X257_AMAMK|nr:hypothetical protein M378DRAFT_165264 [Amanita muscaria Koide BX008]